MLFCLNKHNFGVFLSFICLEAPRFISKKELHLCVAIRIAKLEKFLQPHNQLTEINTARAEYFANIANLDISYKCLSLSFIVFKKFCVI